MNKTAITHVVRSFLPELAIGSACCAAGYFFLVEPLAKQLAAAHAQVDTLSLTIAKAQSQPTAHDAARTAQAKAILDAIAARSSVATDQAQLLQTVSNLADASRVRIEQFNPASPRGPRPTPGQTATKPDPKVEQRSAFSISITATYADAARFIRTLQQEVGFTTIRNIRLVPVSVDKPDLVSVVIDTEHVAVNTKALAASQAAPAAGTGQQAGVPTEHRQ